ncbi:MAG: ATP-binding protein [Candidatus Methanoperedens sp.]|nr:ATP-binding protein [Candidatus Methanoperedens sp.]
MDTKAKLKYVFVEWQERELPEFHMRHKTLRLDSPHVADILGVRRCGKTYFMYQLISSLIESGIQKTNILYINLDDDRLLPLNGDELRLLIDTYREFYEISPKHKLYLFLDEIQNIPDWEKWVKSTYDREQKIKIVISGSNASLLSSDLSTLLTGRHLTSRMFPFSFAEFLEAHEVKLYLKNLQYSKKNIEIKKRFNEYLENGGFPEVIFYPSIKHMELLQSYFEDIINKDIISRHNLRSAQTLKQLSVYCIENIAKTYTFNSLKKIFANYIPLSTDVIINYLSYLENAFLLFSVKHYDYSLKKQINKPRKLYCIDTGMVNAISFRFSNNTGQLYENLVFLQLLRSNREMYYWQDDKGLEVDFVIKEGLKAGRLIQVCSDISDAVTRAREINGLVSGLKHFNIPEGTIITSDLFDEEKVDGKKIRYVPLWYWLLETEELRK